MSALATAQAAFWAAALSRPGAAADALAAQHLAPRPGLTPVGSAGVYRDSVHARHLRELAAAFPRLCLGLGAAAFAELAEAYLADTAGRHAPLTPLGAELPAHLERAGASQAAIDLAALEAMRSAVFAAADAPGLGPEALALPDLGERRLHFVPALLRRACASDMARLVREPERLRRPESCRAEHAALVVWRRGTALHHTRLVGPARQALELAMGGAVLDVVCAPFADAPQPAQAALACVGAWFADGWVAQVA